MQPYLRVEHQLLRDGAAFLSVHEKMIYLLLQSYAGRDGLAFPSHQTLAGAVPCGKTTVKNCLQTLVEKGWIEKVERFDRHGGQTSNGYRIRTGAPGTSRQDPGQETATGGTPAASEEKGFKKPSLKKEPPPQDGVMKIITHFETEIGRVTPSIRRRLAAFLQETSPAVLHHAIEQASAANVRNFNYVTVIIESLKQRNLLTQEQIDRHERRRRTAVARSSRRKGHGPLPDWVERERKQQQQAEAEQKQRFEETVPDQGELAALLAELIG